MFILGWVTVTGDADYGSYALFHSHMHGAPGNRSFYTNEEVDGLLRFWGGPFLVKLFTSHSSNGGGLFVLLLLAVAAAPGVFATHHPTQYQNLTNRFEPPSSDHWFGTDNLRRNVYSRVIHGTRVTLYAAFNSPSWS